jgi:hypothetical protein
MNSLLMRSAAARVAGALTLVVVLWFSVAWAMVEHA